ncbi:MAG: trypsin-like peptidase domain-containing protein [Cellvibrionales bacterium]|nr:trypsin-like peptidase domain-containing protein [Cellvibrionales bacterium]
MKKRFQETWIKDIALPALCGLLIALFYLQYQKIQTLEAAVANMPSNATSSVHLSSAATDSYAVAAEQAMPAVVNIYTRRVVHRVPVVGDPRLQQFLQNSLSPQERVEGALGSGVIVSTEGHVLTNYHVIAGADQVLVSLHDGRDAQAKLVGIDKETDLAVLKISLPELTAIRFGDAQHMRIGDVVLAIGNPLGVGQTVTQGIISAAARYGLELNIQENYLQTDAAINQGNSGGALVDTTGRLVGINTAIQSPTGTSIGIGYAIPSDTAQKVLNDIVSYGRVIRGWIGVESQALNAFASRSLGLEPGQGMIVRSVYRHGPAADAGLLPGDIITHFDGEPAATTRTGMKRITHAQPGEKVEVRFLRDGQTDVVSLTIGIRPGT